MANSRITDRGLLLYYTGFDEISKIDSTELGDLIKKELEWMSGRVSTEPTFDDVRCDILHMHLKEQIVVRDMATKNHKPSTDDEQVKSTTKEQPIPTCDIPKEKKSDVVTEQPIPTCDISSDDETKQSRNGMFKNVYEVAEYLLRVERSDGPFKRDSEMNRICRDYGFDFREVFECFCTQNNGE